MASKLRKWYFCLNERGLSEKTGMAMVAVKSCLRHTALEPHCLYVGRRIEACDDLRKAGVRLIHHTPVMHPALRMAYGDRYPAFVGHWLRMDIPLLEFEDDVVLYTDIDVVFRSMPEAVTRPDLIAAAPEHHRDDRSKFNSGVMLMNLPALRQVDGAFREAVHARLIGDFRYPTHDQASYNAFFGGRIDHLPVELNWKPYWGVNAHAHIIHFHGPKPGLVRRLQRDGVDKIHTSLGTIWQRDPEAYVAYVDLFETERQGALPGQEARPAQATSVIDKPRPGLGSTVLSSSVAGLRRAASAGRRIARKLLAATRPAAARPRSGKGN